MPTAPFGGWISPRAGWYAFVRPAAGCSVLRYCQRCYANTPTTARAYFSASGAGRNSCSRAGALQAHLLQSAQMPLSSGSPAASTCSASGAYTAKAASR